MEVQYSCNFLKGGCIKWIVIIKLGK
jgi:hypothetical protein